MSDVKIFRQLSKSTGSKVGHTEKKACPNVDVQHWGQRLSLPVTSTIRHDSPHIQLCRIAQYRDSQNGIISQSHLRPEKGDIPDMPIQYSWYEPYELAVLETDWENKIENRIDAAESAIRERQRILSLDHEGTPEEQQSLLDTLNGLKSLREDVARWERNTAQAARGGLD